MRTGPAPSRSTTQIEVPETRSPRFVTTAVRPSGETATAFGLIPTLKNAERRRSSDPGRRARAPCADDGDRPRSGEDRSVPPPRLPGESAAMAAAVPRPTKVSAAKRWRQTGTSCGSIRRPPRGFLSPTLLAPAPDARGVPGRRSSQASAAERPSTSAPRRLVEPRGEALRARAAKASQPPGTRRGSRRRPPGRPRERRSARPPRAGGSGRTPDRPAVALHGRAEGRDGQVLRVLGAGSAARSRSVSARTLHGSSGRCSRRPQARHEPELRARKFTSSRSCTEPIRPSGSIVTWTPRN